MASARAAGTNPDVSTFGDEPPRDYDSLDDWEADTDINCIGGTTSPTLDCYDDASPYDQDCVVDGATTNGTYYRTIRPASGEGHSGTNNSGVAFQSDSGVDLFKLLEPYARLEDLLLSQQIDIATNEYVVIVVGGTHAYGTVVGCIAYNSYNDGAGNVSGFYFGTQVGRAFNCLANGRNQGSGQLLNGYEALGDAAHKLYHCQAYNVGSTGFFNSADALLAKNCLSDGAGTDDFADVETGTHWYHCADSDLSLTDEWVNLEILCSGQADDDDLNTLHDDDGDFINNGVRIGMRVKNTSEGWAATITDVVDAGELTLNWDAFDTGENYEISSCYCNLAFTYVNAPGDNFHALVNSPQVEKGMDLSGDFNDDINDGVMGGSKAGETRS